MSARAAGRNARHDLNTALWSCVALLLFTLGRDLQRPVEVRCQAPREAAAVEGWTRDVRCAGDPTAPRLRGPARLLFGQKLDLNRADPRTLAVLPRIGPVRAAAIVRARAEAPFDTPADLERVHGIGPRTIEGLVGRVHAGPRP